ncbi:S24 family peptidase [Nissabacter sp. SGAir0207]|uniref:S24 family peptidase n=1 Tax=Nissabacter sp. SGAir0207 TaxID=2126321 RepID=UPI0010CCB3DF|nr:S24 family peptidase [Nissabacter sp. SGAir0207]QCR38975.1 DNA repair protein [Nissabacter sp. SGAir0207]
MAFPSPARDFVAAPLSIDSLCNIYSPTVYLFRATHSSRLEAIKHGAVLVIDRALTPRDGSIIAAALNGEFQIVRYRTIPRVHLEKLDHPEQRLALTDEEIADNGAGICFGVVTHILNETAPLEQ